jgi:regulator of replication initiation timing
MADNDQPENLILRHLRAIDIRTERTLQEVEALKAHSVALLSAIAALRKDIANLDQRLADDQD